MIKIEQKIEPQILNFEHPKMVLKKNPKNVIKNENIQQNPFHFLDFRTNLDQKTGKNLSILISVFGSIFSSSKKPNPNIDFGNDLQTQT